MPWLSIGHILLRRWRILVVALVCFSAAALQLRDVGAEFIAEAAILTTGPSIDNPTLDASNPRYEAPVTLAIIELEGAPYREFLRSNGLSIHYVLSRANFPVVTITVRAPTYEATEQTILQIVEDFPAIVDRIQSERGAPPFLRTDAELIRFSPPVDRPPGSNRAIVGLLFASAMAAGGFTYGVDQFFGPARQLMKRGREEPPTAVTSEEEATS